MRDSTRHEKVHEAPGILDEPGLFGPYKFIRLKSGRVLTFMDAHREAESAESAFVRGISRCFKLMSAEWDRDFLERRLDHMEDYVNACRSALKRRDAEAAEREKIAQLRDTTGRTPQEAEAYRRKADELEQRLGG